MPGRTPQSPDDRGTPAPAPTDSGICAISPSDLVGYTGNLINRVEQLEQRIAELEAKNVEANQLSDLAQQVGWVDGITYMGVPGWTQTSYGTLIPPPGFTLLGSGLTMSDGNQYQAVVYGEDGELIYGFGQTTSDGTFTPVVGSMASGTNFALLYTDDIRTPQAVGGFLSTPDIHIGYDPTGLVNVSGNQFNVTKAGWYNLSLHCRINGWGTQAAATCQVLWSNAANINAYDAEYGNGPSIINHIGDNGGASGASNVPRSAARMMHLSTGTMGITGSGSGTTTTFLAGAAVVSIQLIREG